MKSLKTKRRWYAFRGRNAQTGEVAIDLMEEIGGYGVSAKNFRDDLSRVGKNESLHVHINSDGGDIIAGLEIYNTLLAHEGNVRVSIGALAASMASVIAMAGDQISIAENGFLMIHDPWSLIMGDAEEMRKAADTMDKMKASIVKAYQRQSGLDADEISQLMADESWLDAGEALDKSFVDSIDFAPEDAAVAVNDLRAACRFDLTSFQHAAVFQNSIQETIRMSQKTIPISGSEGDPPASNATQVLDAERERSAEIMDLATAIKKRDKKDFFNEARKAIADGISAAEFSKSVVQSERYKSVEIIAGGSNPDDGALDIVRNSLGAMVVQNEDYRRMVANGGLVKDQSLTLNFPKFNYGRYRRQFRGATPTTGLPGTGIEILPQIAGLNIQMAKVADVMTGFATGGSSVRYISETSFTNAAAPTAEGTTKPEQVFNFTEIDSPVRKIAVWSKASDEVLT